MSDSPRITFKYM
jgi:tyrosyl-tRNA synthetase